MKRLTVLSLIVILLTSAPIYATSTTHLVIPHLGRVWDIGVLPWDNTARTWPSETLGTSVARLDMTGDFTSNTNTALAGHYTLADGSPGAFYRLDTLSIGDYVWVDIGQTVLVYQVGEIFSVTPDALWVVRPVPNETVLTLLTCDDYDPVMNTYRERLVIWAFEVSG